MALFSSNLKKMQNELDGSVVDWKRLASISSGRYDLSGKSSAEGRILVSTLIKRASDGVEEGTDLAQTIRNIHSRGGDFNRALNESGGTAIHIAAELKSPFLLKALLDAGIPPVATTHSGATPLHRAVASGMEENVRLLLAAGADPGAEDNLRNSPLHIAAQFNSDLNIAKLLLDAGAKAYQRNANKKRPVDLALDRNFSACAELLTENLRKLRKSRQTEWKCPQCGAAMKRPSAEKIGWYLGLEMWDHLRFTCGSCGKISSSIQLDGEI